MPRTGFIVSRSRPHGNCGAHRTTSAMRAKSPNPKITTGAQGGSVFEIRVDSGSACGAGCCDDVLEPPRLRGAGPTGPEPIWTPGPVEPVEVPVLPVGSV